MKRMKYGNRKVEYAGMKFDSARERDRYIYLVKAVERGEIRDLRRQVEYELIPALKEAQEVVLRTKTKVVEKVVQRAVVYRADFVYIRVSDGVEVVEDIKISPALLPKEYILKEKLFRWRYGKAIRRVYKAAEAVC